MQSRLAKTLRIPLLLAIGFVAMLFWMAPPKFDGLTVHGWIQNIKGEASPFRSVPYDISVKECAAVMQKNKERSLPELLEFHYQASRPPKKNKTVEEIKATIHRYIPFLFKQSNPNAGRSDTIVVAAILDAMNLKYVDLADTIQPWLSSSDPIDHWAGLRAMLYVDDRPDLIIQELEKALKSPTASHQNAALFLCGQYGTNAASLVPEIVRYVDPDNLNTPRSRIALQALNQIGPPSQSVFPELLSIFQKADSQSKRRILRIFTLGGPDSFSLTNQMQTVLQTSTNGMERILAAEVLLKINPHHQEAQRTLLDLLLFEEDRKRHGVDVNDITHSLANLGTNAQFAVSALAMMIQNGYHNQVAGSLRAGIQTEQAGKLLQLAEQRLTASEVTEFKMNLTSHLLQIDPTNSAALENLNQMLQSDEELQVGRGLRIVGYSSIDLSHVKQSLLKIQKEGSLQSSKKASAILDRLK